MLCISPDFLGPTATKVLRRLGYTGPIIGVTGNVLSEDVEHFMAHGASEVVGKPLRPNTIQQVFLLLSFSDLFASGAGL